MSRRLELFVLLLILAGALALRLYDLRGAPPGAQHDEVFSTNFATQILDGAHPVFWDQNGGVAVLHSYLVALAFALFGTPLSIVVTLRMVSVVCGLLTILFTYLTARHLFGAGVAILSAALMAASQWQLFESRVGLEPITLMMLASVTAWGFLKTTVDGRRQTAVSNQQSAVSHKPSAISLSQSTINNQQSTIRRLPSAVRRLPSDLFVGAALGLTMYTYQPAPLVGLALVGFAGYLLIWQRAQFRAQWLALARVFIIAALVTLPLARHLLTTEGDASSRVEDLSLDLRIAIEGDFGPLLADGAGVLGMMAFSGDPSFRYNLPLRPVFTPLVGLLAYAGLLLSLWRWRDSRYAFIVIWIVCTVLASAVTRASPSYLRSSAALVMMVMLPGIALSAISNQLSAVMQRLDKRHATRLSHLASRISYLAIVTIAVGLVAWETARTAQDYFVTWANLDRVRTTYRADLAEMAAFLETQKPSGIVMLSARYPSDLDQGALYLLQQQQRQRYQWYNGRRVLVLPIDPIQQGAAYLIPASNGSQGDGAALLSTLAARPGALDEHGNPAFMLYTLPAPQLAMLRARTPQNVLHANAGNEVDLIGVDTKLTARTLHILLYWQVVHRVPGDHDRSFFTHLVDANGKLLAQQDISAYPTSSWTDGDIVWQWYDLQIPADASGGFYWLELGIYDANAPGQPRVPIIGSDGKVANNHVRVLVVSP